jgi:hypothetical protein
MGQLNILQFITIIIIARATIFLQKALAKFGVLSISLGNLSF